jgi:hypothetical protein
MKQPPVIGGKNGISDESSASEVVAQVSYYLMECPQLSLRAKFCTAPLDATLAGVTPDPSAGR